MNRAISVVTTILMVSALAACSGSPVEVVPGVSVVEDSSSTSTEAAVAATAVASVAEAQAENSAPNAEAGDFAWDSAAVSAIQLNGDAISAELVAGMLAAPNLGPQFGAEFNSIYPDVARKHGADLYPFFLANVAGVRGLNLGDGIHPNFQGIKRMVTGILPNVLSALGRKD